MLGLNQPRQLRLAGVFYGSLTQIIFSKPRMRQINEVDQFSFDFFSMVCSFGIWLIFGLSHFMCKMFGLSQATTAGNSETQ